MDSATQQEGSGAPEPAEMIRTLLAEQEGPLLRYALSLLGGDLERARDCVQDTFLRLCEQTPDRLADRLTPWLFTVCRNRALDMQRKENRMTPLDEMALESQPAVERTPSADAEFRESAASALDLLQALPPNQREVVRLKFQNQLSYQEISEVTALSVSNVGFLLHTALRTLRRQMDALQRPMQNSNPTLRANPSR